MKLKHPIILLIFFSLHSCIGGSENSKNNSKQSSIEIIDFDCINSYPHDTTSCTEGFFIDNGNLYESTGSYLESPQYRSLFGIVDLTTGKIDIKAEIDRIKYNGEGIALLNGKVYQLTNITNIGFVYDTITFKKINEFTWPNDDGWGLTADGTYLILSDGSHELTYLNPSTFQAVKKVSVTEKGLNKQYLNELEYIKGYIYANVWLTNTIVKINPKDGKIEGKLDLTELYKDSKKLFPGSLEMNGIAYNPATGRVFVTGKLWPRIYELRIDGL